MEQIVSFKSVYKSYNDNDVINDLSFSIQKEDVIGVLGPSGVGKSTMIKLIGGIEDATSGELSVSAKRIGYVFQEPRLLPWQTAIENVMLPMKAMNMPKEEAYKSAKYTLEKMGLGGFFDHYPRQLSGGMIQRVSLARALAVKPDLLLMDEPFAALDLRLKEILVFFLKEHLKQHPATVVYISHAPDEVLQIANRIFMFDKDFSFEEIPARRDALRKYYTESQLSNFTEDDRGEEKMQDWKEKKSSFEVVDGRGKTPEFLPEMLAKAEKVKRGEGIKVIQNFEPVPLYFHMEKLGFERDTEKISDEEYHAYFYRKPEGDTTKSGKMAEYVNVDQDRADKIVNIITSFFDGKKIEELQADYDELAPVSAAEFAFAEQIISDKGVPDAHFEQNINTLISLYRSSLDQEGFGEYPEGHPVSNYAAENKEIAKKVQKIREHLKGDIDTAFLMDAYKDLKNINQHYVRKENQLFPYLERKGFDKPSTVMWSLHDKIRQSIKDSISMLANDEMEAFMNAQEETLTEITEMIYKEEKILLPTSITMLTDAEWRLMRKGERELEYCFIEEPPMWGGDVAEEAKAPAAGNMPVSTGESGVYVKLGEGMLTLDQINAIFCNLPVDVSFVDHTDRVRFYNQTDHRIFPRSPDVIGREVRYCHPPKSVDTVMEIISEFKAGNKDTAEFWLTLNERFLHIRYFAVRNSAGGYMGVLEMMQDVTDIRALEGNRTLLTWGD